MGGWRGGEAGFSSVAVHWSTATVQSYHQGRCDSAFEHCRILSHHQGTDEVHRALQKCSHIVVKGTVEVHSSTASAVKSSSKALRKCIEIQALQKCKHIVVNGTAEVHALKKCNQAKQKSNS